MSTLLALASNLEIDEVLSNAEQLLSEPNTKEALKSCFDQFGAQGLASILRGLAAAKNDAVTEIRAVWSGPTFEGDGDHTTKALAYLIDEATEDVFASTFSATADSAFVEALWRAIARGVRVTMLVDSKIQDGATAKMLQEKLNGANFLTYVPPGGAYGVQHSKVIVVDSKLALVTSANLSTAGAEKNLEAGVIIHDPKFASDMRQRFQKLAASGALVKLGN